jgi:hypothetical protein
MHELNTADLALVTGGGKASTAWKGIKKAYEVTQKGVEVVATVGAAADLAYRGFNWVTGRNRQP